MFTNRTGDLDAKRFWRWFANEADGCCNSLEALSRGEDDGDWLWEKVAHRIQRYDSSMSADIIRTLDGGCELRLSGGSDASTAALLAAAPRINGWRFAAASEPAARVPFKRAPQPSLDIAAFIQGRHEAYAS